MDRTKISQNAALVWSALGDCREWTYEELMIETGLTEQELHTAIGWLAHENKVCFEYDKGRTYLTLGVNIYIG